MYKILLKNEGGDWKRKKKRKRERERERLNINYMLLDRDTVSKSALTHKLDSSTMTVNMPTNKNSTQKEAHVITPLLAGKLPCCNAH